MIASLLAALAAATPVQAAPATYLNAGDLRARCTSAVAADASYCFAYVAGVHDAVRAYESWLNLREFCTPAGTPQGELRRAFIEYLDANPGFAAGEAASVVVVALKTRYPCSPVATAPTRPPG